MKKNNQTIPKGWKNVKLGSIVEINPRIKEDIPDEEIVGFISMADVSNESIVTNIQEKTYKDVKKGFTNFRPKDVLFAKITPCMENGKGGICPDEYKYYFGSTEFHILRPKHETTSEYVYYIVTQQSFRKLAERNMKGSAGQKRVPKEFLENYEILLPPVFEQKRITEGLTVVDSEIQKNDQLKEKLTALKKGLMSDLLSGKVRVSIK